MNILLRKRLFNAVVQAINNRVAHGTLFKNPFPKGSDHLFSPSIDGPNILQFDDSGWPRLEYFFGIVEDVGRNIKNGFIDFTHYRHLTMREAVNDSLNLPRFILGMPNFGPPTHRPGFNPFLRRFPF